MVAGTVALLAAMLPPVGAQTATDEVPAGDWTGWLTFVTSGPRNIAGAGSGTFEMTSASGALEGDARWVFESSVSPVDVTAVVQGEATAPELQVTSLVINGSPSPVSASDPAIPLTITTATCEMVTGSGSGVGTVTATGEWAAVRAGALSGDPAAFQQDLTDLTLRIESIQADLLAGQPADRWDLFAATLLAEDLTQALARSPECGGPATARSSIAVGLIADLLASVIADGREIDTQWFVDLVRAAVDVGAIGAGSSGPAAETLEADVITEIQFRIDEAVAGGDIATLLDLAALSYQLGYRSLEEAALDGIDEVADS